MKRTFALLLAGFLLVLLGHASLVLADGAAKQNPSPFYPDKMKLMVWRDEQGAEHPVTNAQDWQRRREHILANMQLVMGPLPDPSRRVAYERRYQLYKQVYPALRQINHGLGACESIGG